MMCLLTKGWKRRSIRVGREGEMGFLRGVEEAVDKARAASMARTVAGFGGG